MSIQPGSRLGPYEIVTRVGAGGMGEVFRARDTRLDRTVAVKTLPAELARDAQLRLRFQREAKAISALSHPNICALYDVGEQDGVDFLVMEFLEGETLAERLERGALPLKEALRYAIDIAAALERAHRDGVVHRDLKPGNVMLTRGGAKLLDFGLAKAAAEAQPAISVDAPTVAQKAPLTAEGSIVGTFQYMAPEQLESADVDPRTDLFALGAVIYEMVTGRRAFSGKTKTSLIAAIVAGSPRPMSELQPVTPAGLEHIVQRCLEKDQEARWQSAHDVRLELEWVAKNADARVEAQRPRSSLLPWIAAACALVLAAIAGAYAWRNAHRDIARTAVTAQILAPAGKELNDPMTALSISPDGRLVTYRATSDRRLWVRDIASGEARQVDGTEDASLPFWSPDSKSIAFFAGGKLKKVTLNGAPPVTLCDAPKGRSGGWNADGTIIFAPTAVSGLSRVSQDGGEPVALTQLDASKDETTHRWATFLPDGKHFLYLAGSHREATNRELDAVYVSSLDEPKSRKLLLRARSNVAYASGHLLYEKDGVLLARPFDAGELRFTGDPYRVGAAVEVNTALFRSAFAVAGDGTLVYHQRGGPESLHFVSVEAGGVQKELFRPQLDVEAFLLSPDGQKMLVRAVDAQSGYGDLWLFDMNRSGAKRLTSTADVNEWDAAWLHDSRRIVLTRSHGFGVDEQQIVLRSLDTDAPEEVLYRGAEMPYSYNTADVTHDATYAIVVKHDTQRDGNAEIDRLALHPGAKPEALVTGAAEPSVPVLSPDDRWLAYRAYDSGQPEVYISRYPNGAARTQITFDTAYRAQWIGNDALLLLKKDGFDLVRLTFDGNTVRVGDPQRIVNHPPDLENVATIDGKHFVYLLKDRNDYLRSITLVTDWKR
ncbi:MAG TPA: protein kinase [Thermoanaerobaculia bacterium]|jgi:serine/threonine protein kinase